MSEQCFKCIPLTSASVRALEEGWGDLANVAETPNLFLEPKCVAAALSLYDGRDVEIIYASHEQKMIFLSLMEGAKGYAKLPVSFSQAAAHTHAYLAHPLVRKGYEEEAAMLFCQWIDSTRKRFCFLKNVVLESNFLTALSEVCTAQRRVYSVPVAFSRAAIRYHGDYDTYLNSTLSKKRRKNIGRLYRRLEERGPVSFQQWDASADIDTWLTDFLEMENTGWKKENGTAILCREADINFFEILVKDAATQGNLRFSRLLCGKEAIAYALDIVSTNEAFALKVAYDPAFADYSPGALLEVEVLKRHIADPQISCVDSCTTADNSLVNSLWGERKEIGSLLIGSDAGLSGMITRMLVALESLASIVRVKIEKLFRRVNGIL